MSLSSWVDQYIVIIIIIIIQAHAVLNVSQFPLLITAPCLFAFRSFGLNGQNSQNGALCAWLPLCIYILLLRLCYHHDYYYSHCAQLNRCGAITLHKLCFPNGDQLWLLSSLLSLTEVFRQMELPNTKLWHWFIRN